MCEATEAEYVDGRRVSGLRSVVPAQAAVNALKRYFGKRHLQSLSYGDIRSYRMARLKEPTPADLPRHRRALETEPKAELKVTRTLATVNRELSKLRRMLNIAQREGWIKQNPFAAGESLISLADERKRERILTRAEERNLLKACSGHQYWEHLRPILICAIDTGMRRGEILSLRVCMTSISKRDYQYSGLQYKDRTISPSIDDRTTRERTPNTLGAEYAGPAATSLRHCQQRKAVIHCGPQSSGLARRSFSRSATHTRNPVSLATLAPQ